MIQYSLHVSDNSLGRRKHHATRAVSSSNRFSQFVESLQSSCQRTHRPLPGTRILLEPVAQFQQRFLATTIEPTALEGLDSFKNAR